MQKFLCGRSVVISKRFGITSKFRQCRTPDFEVHIAEFLENLHSAVINACWRQRRITTLNVNFVSRFLSIPIIILHFYEYSGCHTPIEHFLMLRRKSRTGRLVNILKMREKKTWYFTSSLSRLIAHMFLKWTEEVTHFI